jgi:hypothetical protein
MICAVCVIAGFPTITSHCRRQFSLFRVVTQSNLVEKENFMRSYSFPALRVAGISLLTFAAALAASSVQAQSLILNSGDNATVSSTGTFGKIGGTSFSNNISNYGATYGTIVQTSGTAAFTLAGGTMFAPDGDTDIAAGGSGPITISGGSIGASHGSNGLLASGSGPIVISGGTFKGDSLSTSIGISQGAAVQITGGDFTSAAPLGVASGSSLYLFSKNDSPFTVTGIPGQSFSGMAYNNTSLDLSSLGAAPFSLFGISGTLADGELFNVSLRGLGTLDFNMPAPAAVPEASTTISFGILLMLGVGGLVLAKRRAKTAVENLAA